MSRASDGKIFFTHGTSDRYIAAVWSADSARCLALDAPDNANSYLWLFRVQGREIATEKIDYDNISKIIETAVPAARPDKDALTRSGIEKIEWLSPSELRLQIIYNNVPVTALVDVAQSRSPRIHVVPHKKT
jgi:hypothetical protein